MTIAHDTRTGILTVTLSCDEHLAIVDANLPVETETAIRGRAILEVIQEEKQIIESVGLKVSETRLVLANDLALRARSDS